MNYRFLLVSSLTFSLSTLTAMDGKPIPIAIIPETDSIYAVSLLDAFMQGQSAIKSQSNNQITFPHAHEPAVSLSQGSLQAFTLLEKICKEKFSRSSLEDMSGLILRAKRFHNLSNEEAVDQFMQRMSCDQELELLINSGSAHVFENLFLITNPDEIAIKIAQIDLVGQEEMESAFQDGQPTEAIMVHARNALEVLPEYLNSRYVLLQALKRGISAEINAASSHCVRTELVPNGRSKFRTQLLKSIGSDADFKSTKRKQAFTLLLSTALHFARSKGYPTFVVSTTRENVWQFAKHQKDHAMIRCTTRGGNERPSDECEVEFDTNAPIT